LTAPGHAVILARFGKNRLMPIHKLVGFMVLAWAVFGIAPSALADIYMYKDKNGVITFTNVPNHTAYRRVLRSANNSLPSVGQFNASYDHLIRTASGRHSVDADLIRAVIKTESDFNAAARSHKGAMGLMQLMPDTARLHNVVDAYDPVENVEGGVRHLRMLLDRYQGNLELSLAAYNAGSGAVEKYRGIPPFAETKEYVRRVLRFYDSYRGEGLQAVNSIRQ
jgi:soluble lytic murein transglycosylase